MQIVRSAGVLLGDVLTHTWCELFISSALLLLLLLLLHASRVLPTDR